MIENINEEKLKKIINECIIPGSSIGIHGIKKSNGQEIANSILNTGLNMSISHPGLTGTICFLNTEDDKFLDDILYYSESNPDKNGNYYNIICSIPDVIKDRFGTKYYLGKYTSFPEYGEKDYKSHSLPTHYLNVLPCEFIVGCLVRNYNKESKKFKYSFILNTNYIGLKDNDYKIMFYDKFLHLLNTNISLKAPLPLNEDGYEKAKSDMDIFPDNESWTHYYKLFIKKYEEITKSKQM